MNVRTACIVLPMVLLAASVAACDRRDAEPIEPSDTTDTVVDEPPATTTPATPVPEATAPASTTDACAGLTGEAEADCLMRSNDGLPPTPPPVNPEEETGDDAPPTP